MTITDFIYDNLAYTGSWTLFAALATAVALAISEWLGEPDRSERHRRRPR